MLTTISYVDPKNLLAKEEKRCLFLAYRGTKVLKYFNRAPKRKPASRVLRLIPATGELVFAEISQVRMKVESFYRNPDVGLQAHISKHHRLRILTRIRAMTIFVTKRKGRETKTSLNLVFSSEEEADDWEKALECVVEGRGEAFDPFEYEKEVEEKDPDAGGDMDGDMDELETKAGQAGVDGDGGGGILDDSDAEDDNRDDDDLKDGKRRKKGKVKRRMAVSEETSKKDVDENYEPPKYPKTAEITIKLTRGVKGNVLLKKLDSKMTELVVDMMFSVEVNEGEEVVKQGDKGENLYVIEKGKFAVLIQQENGQAVEVAELSSEASFGELALMYNCPRAATIKAKTDGVLWAIDRQGFAYVMRNSKAAKYAAFIRDISLFEHLPDDRVVELADRVTTEFYREGTALVQLGDKLDKIIMVVSGELSLVEKRSTTLYSTTVSVPSSGKENVSKADNTAAQADSQHPLNAKGEETKISRGYFMKDVILPYTVFMGKECTGDVIAKSDVSCIVLNKDDILKTLTALEAEKILYPFYLSLLRHIPMLFDLSEEALINLVDRRVERPYEPGDMMMTEGEESSYFQIVVYGHGISEGSVDSVTVQAKDPKIDNWITEGDCFGENCLLTVKSNPFTLQAVTRVHTIAFSQMTMEDVCGPLETTLNRVAHKRVLAQVPILQSLKSGEFEKLLDTLEEESFTKGEVIIKQGEIGSKFYIVTKGSVKVSRSMRPGEPPKTVAVLSSGKYFGERALLRDEPRAATCEADSEIATVVTISRPAFNDVLGPLQKLIEEEMKIREVKAEAANFNFTDIDTQMTLGIGTFGRVLLGQNKVTRQTCAIKRLSKKAILESGQKDHLRNEVSVMREIDHPFCLKMQGTYNDNRYFYIVTEALLGGELFTLLGDEGSLNEEASKFYAANIVIALDYLHRKNIVYRDLKPENLLLDQQGYLKVVDFGFSKKIAGRTYTVCGTPEYLAPEIISRKGHGKAVDWWALGILIVEMVTGESPFAADSATKTFARILDEEPHIEDPAALSPELLDLVQRLLQKNPLERLGTARGATEIKRHKWFEHVDWERLERRRVEPPFVPKLEGPLDTSNFDEYSEDEDEADECHADFDF